MRARDAISGLLAVALGATPAARGAEFSYASLDTALVRHARGGRVDYGALAGDRGPLERFLVAARDARPDGWPRAEQLAFWVNVYNARVLDGVIRRPGLQSVLDVGRTLGVPTFAFFRERSVSGGRELSLHDIETGILRNGFHEPRIHFVLNCASASCPVLPAHPLTAGTLEPMLDRAARAFLDDTARNQLDPGKELRLSSIFKWYAEDFSAAGGVRAFVLAHAPGASALQGNESIHYLDYDWSLNGDWGPAAAALDGPADGRPAMGRSPARPSSARRR